ncbi:MAG: dihydroneopterin aldolase [Deltaproteobacteria bacterium]|nr:dihydroneopterin aldolase [Deltaproteobacteria bacterium]MBI4373886.1 dihydroneopterin aldolase [Deltaproteobacteria bacterium]
MKLRIKNLRFRTIIGTHDRERKVEQEIVIQIEAEIDGAKAARTDKLQDALNYKKLTDEITKLVESSQFFLIEKMAQVILALLMKNKKVIHAKVEIEKPGALDTADSVSIELSSDET